MGLKVKNKVWWCDANLINTSQWRHIHSLSSDCASTAYTCRVFSRTRVDNSWHQNLQWILQIPKGVGGSLSLLTFTVSCVQAACTNKSEQTKCTVIHHTVTLFTLQFSAFLRNILPLPSGLWAAQLWIWGMWGANACHSITSHKIWIC